MAYLTRAVLGLGLGLLASACSGSSSESPGAGGSSPGIILGKGGTGSGSNGLAGAGSGSGGAGNGAGAPNRLSACPTVTPCGGNLVGDWTIQQECIALPTDSVEWCAGATFALSPVTATGSVSFKADHSMTSSGTVSWSESVRLPPSCYTEDLCSELGPRMSKEPSVTNAQCGYDAVTGCSCSLTYSMTSMGSGTYQVQGNNVTFASDSNPDGEPEDYAFCVSDNTASFYHDSDIGLSATLILTK
ncbi:MAG: hypothetical protein WDO74_25475 [Pseudomonadota bacterium]